MLIRVAKRITKVGEKTKMRNYDLQEFYFQSRELTKKQVRKVSDLVAAGRAILPLTSADVHVLVDSNFRYRMGTLIRRTEHSTNKLERPMSFEREQRRYDEIIDQIGQTVTRNVTQSQDTIESVTYADFSPSVQDLELAA